MALLKHGLDVKRQEVVSINDVASGLGCNCVCPSCGEKLVARKGEINQWHFAHNSNESCAYAEQTAVHLIAKDIIAKHGVFLPKIIPLLKEFPVDEIKSFSIDKCSFLKKKVITETGQLIRFNNVRVEKKIGNIIPDIIAEYNGVTILIEIAVTHFIDAVKLEKLKALGMPCLEIDCSHLRCSENLEQDLIQFLLTNDVKRKWIISPVCTIIDFDVCLERVNKNLLIHKEKQQARNDASNYERLAKYRYRKFKESQKGDIGRLEIKIKKMDADCYYISEIKNPYYDDGLNLDGLDLSGLCGLWFDDDGFQIIEGGYFGEDIEEDIEEDVLYFTSEKECKEAVLILISKEWKALAQEAYEKLEQAKTTLAKLEKDCSPEAEIEVVIKCEI